MELLHEGVRKYLMELGVTRYDIQGETAENIYETMYLKDFDKPDKEEFLLKVVEKQNEYLMDLLRDKRNKLLLESDWTQNGDVILNNKQDWETYRQALRDLPSNAIPTSEDMSDLFPSKP